MGSQLDRSKLASWFSTEVPDTLDDFAQFIIESLSVVLNVSITLIVVAFTIGFQFSLIIFCAILISISMVYLLRRKIASQGVNLQQARLAVSTWYAVLFDNLFDGNKNTFTSYSIKFFEVLKKYFEKRWSFIVLEQFVTGSPIVLIVPVLLLMLNISNDFNVSEIGMMVAILPRLLQTLGNVHALSNIFSRFIFLSARLNYLFDFIDDLPSVDWLSNVNWNRLRVVSQKDDSILSAQEFLESVDFQNEVGRWTLGGENGSGKSSLLRFIKEAQMDAVYLGPNSFLLDIDIKNQSSGQILMCQIDVVLNSSARIFLLDEWDANLDSGNVRKIEERLEYLIKTCLVIDVRH